MPTFSKLFNKKQNKLLEAELLENGLAVGTISYADKSKYSRAQLCLIRAILIFLAAYGTVGSMVSSFGLPFMKAPVIIGSLLICGYIAFLYYNRFTFYVGYILYFIIFTASIFSLYWYVNSGAQAYINTLYEKYSDYYALDTLREGKEFITDRNITVSITMLFVVAFLALLLNITISGYMSLIETFLITFPLMQFGLYIDFKPNVVYLVMLLSVYITVAILGRSSHYRIPDFRSSGQDFISIRLGKKNASYKIMHSYISDGTSLITTTVFSIVLCIIFLISTSLIFYSDFGSKYVKNKLKDTTDEYVQMYLQNGIWGFFDRYSAKGGVNNGMLGGISSVRPDYQTDIIIQFVPINTNSIYLKAFEGNRYTYNMFSSDFANVDFSPEAFCIASQIPSKYSTAKMNINNVDANADYDYLPYYGSAIMNKEVSEGSITYDGYFTPSEYASYIPLGSVDFPLVPAEAPSAETVSYAYSNCTEVPLHLIDCLDEFIDNSELAKYRGVLTSDISPEDRQKVTIEIAETLRKIYMDDYSYTMAPGTTPRNRDVVEYFLDVQKRGYCVHFASSSSLILRRLGVPTKYVEGYMVSFADIMESEAISSDTTGWIEDSAYIAFMDTGVVELEVTDGSAHAWTEIYVDGYGWIPYDFTPPSSEDITTNFSLGSFFSSLFKTKPGDTESDTGNNQGGTGNNSTFSISTTFGFILYPMLCIIAFIVALIVCIKCSRRISKLIVIRKCYRKGEYGKAMQLYYSYFHDYAKHKLSIKEADITPANLAAKLESLQILDSSTSDKISTMINKALYSQDSITKSEYIDTTSLLKNSRKAIKKYKAPKPQKN